MKLQDVKFELMELKAQLELEIKTLALLNAEFIKTPLTINGYINRKYYNLSINVNAKTLEKDELLSKIISKEYIIELMKTGVSYDIAEKQSMIRSLEIEVSKLEKENIDRESVIAKGQDRLNKATENGKYEPSEIDDLLAPHYNIQSEMGIAVETLFDLSVNVSMLRMKYEKTKDKIKQKQEEIKELQSFLQR